MATIKVEVNGSNNVLNALQTYKTIILKPNIHDVRNILPINILNEPNTKYVIKWDFDLDGQTVFVGENCIIEFDGGSFKNGILVGNDTVLLYYQDLDTVIKDTVELQGTFVYNNGSEVADEEDITAIDNKLKFKDKAYAPNDHSGLGRIYLRKNIEEGVWGETINSDDCVLEEGQYGKSITTPIDFGSEDVRADITINGVTNPKGYSLSLTKYKNGEGGGAASPVANFGWSSHFGENIAETYKSFFEGSYIPFINEDDYDFIIVVLSKLDGEILDTDTVSFSITSKTASKNILTQAMLNKTNTIYHIQYDYDLNGQSITVPENCVLQFDGGSLSNGTIVGDDIIVNSNYNALYCSISGTIVNQINLFDSGSTDINTSILKSCVNGVSLMEDITIKGCSLRSNINGNNHSITIVGSRNFLTISRKDIIIESTTFIKDSNITDPSDRYMFKVGNNDNFVLDSCKVYNGSVTAGASWEQYEETGTCKNVKITNCHFNVDWTTLDALNPGQETQNDIFVFGGCDNISIENCYIKFKNTNRVFKTFANKSSDGQYDTQNLENLARTISIRNNTIIGESTTINGKQVYDMFSASTNVYICNNYIEVRGYNRIFDNKTSATDSNYNNIIVIENNIIKTENIIMCLRLKGYDTTVVFSKNECIAPEASTLTGLLIYPLYIKHAKKVVIEDNSFKYTAGNKYLFYLHSDDETVGNIDSLTINRNIISSGYKACLYVDNCTVKDLQFTYNCIEADDKHITFGNDFKINRLTFIDRNNFVSRTNYYISNKPNAIDYLYFDVPYVSGQKLIGSGAGIPTIVTPLKIQGTNNLTCAGYSGSSNPSSLIHVGETFYNTSINKNVIWNGTKWAEEDGATAGVARSGDTTQRPNGADIYLGFEYFDTDLNKKIVASNITNQGVVTWREEDGAKAGVLRSGTNLERPAGNQIYVGFMYLDISLAKTIYASSISGNDVIWIDANGNNVSE